MLLKTHLTLPASCVFCRLQMIFANSLNLDQARQNVRPELGSKLFDTDAIPGRIF